MDKTLNTKFGMFKSIARTVKKAGLNVSLANRDNAMLTDNFNNPNMNYTVPQKIRGAVYKAVEEATLGNMGAIGRGAMWKRRGDQKAFKREISRVFSSATTGRMGYLGEAISAKLTKTLGTYDDNPDIINQINNIHKRKRPGETLELSSVLEGLENTAKAIDGKFGSLRSAFDDVSKGYSKIDDRIAAIEKKTQENIQSAVGVISDEQALKDRQDRSAIDNLAQSMSFVQRTVGEHESSIKRIEGMISFLKSNAKFEGGANDNTKEDVLQTSSQKRHSRLMGMLRKGGIASSMAARLLGATPMGRMAGIAAGVAGGVAGGVAMFSGAFGGGDSGGGDSGGGEAGESAGTGKSSWGSNIPMGGEGLVGGAGVPKSMSENKEVIAALNQVARKHGVDPAAVAQVINMESRWNTKQKTGSYRGLTQMGRKTFEEAGGKIGGMTYDEYYSAPPEEQIKTYGAWLDHYGFADKNAKAGLDISSMNPAQQAAVLQATQFAPNAMRWRKAAAQGNFNVRVTATQQARALGSTSLADMSSYYANQLQKSPGVYDKMPEISDGTQIADTDKKPSNSIFGNIFSSPAEAAGVLPGLSMTSPSNLSIAGDTDKANFGVGKAFGKEIKTQTEIAKRTNFSKGNITFPGIEGLENISFKAGSGGNARFPSVPTGTYSLKPQSTGGVITDYYRRHGMSTKGAFGRVYNVGVPNAPTKVGYDPKVGRNRTQIQIHSNVRKDVNKLISSGCLTVTPEEYPKLVAAIEHARKQTGGDVALVVQNDNKGNASFQIMPAAMATNSISVDQAARNLTKTGNISGRKGEIEIPSIAENAANLGVLSPSAYKQVGKSLARFKENIPSEVRNQLITPKELETDSIEPMRIEGSIAQTDRDNIINTEMVKSNQSVNGAITSQEIPQAVEARPFSAAAESLGKGMSEGVKPVEMPARYEAGSIAPKDSTVVDATQAPTAMEIAKTAEGSNEGYKGESTKDARGDPEAYEGGTKSLRSPYSNPESAPASPGDGGYGEYRNCYI